MRTTNATQIFLARQRSGMSLFALRGIHRSVASFIATVVLLAMPTCSFAGDMDGLGFVLIAFAVGVGVVILLLIVMLWAARFIRNRRLRIYLRFLLIVFVFTPVPIVAYYDQVGLRPAFLAWISATNYWPKDGVFSHPILLAYACVITLMLPALILWTYASERERFIRESASFHRPTAPVNATAAIVKTPDSQ
jgi:hypothetical protein